MRLFRGRDTIAMAWTETHPRNSETSIYYAAYRSGALRRADGSVISTMADPPITATQGEKVYDWRTDGKAWVHDVALDRDGHPVIVYATFPTDSDHRYRYARWDGTRWIDRELVRAGGSMSVDPEEPNYSGGITLNHDDPSTVYLSRQVNGSFEVEVWSTRDGGASWSWRRLTPPAAGNNYRPISPRGQRGDDMDVVWMHGAYPSFTSFRTGLRTQVRARAGSAALIRTLRPVGALPQTGAPIVVTTMRVTSTATVMADPNPRSTPIPISQAAQAAD